MDVSKWRRVYSSMSFLQNNSWYVLVLEKLILFFRNSLRMKLDYRQYLRNNRKLDSTLLNCILARIATLLRIGYTIYESHVCVWSATTDVLVVMVLAEGVSTTSYMVLNFGCGLIYFETIGKCLRTMENDWTELGWFVLEHIVCQNLLK